MRLRDLIAQNRETLQLVYGIALLVLIPLLIAANTVFIIRKYNQSIDVILQRHALSLGRTVATLIKSDLPWQDFVQAKLDALLAGNVEIQALAVLTPDGDSFTVAASTEPDTVNTKTDAQYFRLAWMQERDSGLAADSRTLIAGSDPAGLSASTDRYWLVALPLWDEGGQKQALLTVRLSSAIVDELTTYNRNASLMLLVGIMVAAILFLLVAIRSWDYVLLYQKTREIDRMKDEFIALASHELKAPVTYIRGFAEMIGDGSLGAASAKVSDAAKKITIGADQLAALVEDLLEVSRIEQGRLKVSLAPAAIGPIIADVIEQLRPQAAAKKLSVTAVLPEGLPAAQIDPVRFRQILVNLVGNAIKYTEEGEVSVAAEERYHGSVIEIKVKDSGIGMSAQDREHLFDKFYRIQNDRTRNVPGTGLGLWITKELLTLMKGVITVDSIEGVGTQITVQVPVAKIRQ